MKKGVQNAQMQGSQARRSSDTLDVRGAWSMRTAEGDGVSREGLSV